MGILRIFIQWIHHQYVYSKMLPSPHHVEPALAEGPWHAGQAVRLTAGWTGTSGTSGTWCYCRQFWRSARRFWSGSAHRPSFYQDADILAPRCHGSDSPPPWGSPRQPRVHLKLVGVVRRTREAVTLPPLLPPTLAALALPDAGHSAHLALDTVAFLPSSAHSPGKHQCTYQADEIPGAASRSGLITQHSSTGAASSPARPAPRPSSSSSPEGRVGEEAPVFKHTQ